MVLLAIVGLISILSVALLTIRATLTWIGKINSHLSSVEKLESNFKRVK
jgi:hypothetical protein